MQRRPEVTPNPPIRGGASPDVLVTRSQRRDRQEDHPSAETRDRNTRLPKSSYHPPPEGEYWRANETSQHGSHCTDLPCSTHDSIQ